MSQRTCCSRPSRMPPSPARPAPTTHTMRMIRSVLMPVVEARSGLSETARMALPVRVRSSQYATPSAASTQIVIAIIERAVRSTGPIFVADCTAYWR